MEFDFGDLMNQFAEHGEMKEGGAVRPKFAPDIEALRLREAYASFTTPHIFTPGMIIRQKKGIGGYRTYGVNDFAIVLRVLEEPHIAEASNSNSQSSPWYRTPLSMIIGCIVENEEFLIYHVDGRRFEPVPLSEIKNDKIQ